LLWTTPNPGCARLKTRLYLKKAARGVLTKGSTIVSNSLFGQEVFCSKPNHGINNSEVLVGGGLGDLKSLPDVGPKGLGVLFPQDLVLVPVPVDPAELWVDFDLGTGSEVVDPR